MTHRRDRGESAAAGGGDDRLDRFATYRAFSHDGRAAALVKLTGSIAAPYLCRELWGLADARTGLIRGASVPRLALLTGMNEKTVRSALKALIAAGELILTGETRNQVPVYQFPHLTRADAAARSKRCKSY